MQERDIRRAQYITYLIHRSKTHALSEAEQFYLNAWLQEDPKHQALMTELLDDQAEAQALQSMHRYTVESSLAKVKAMMVAETPVKLWRKRYASLSVAAVILVMLMSAWWLFMQHPVEDIAPGTHRATLTWDDGPAIELIGDKEGIRMDKTNWSYLDGSRMMKTKGEESAGRHYATLATPRGGQYQVVLPDGTQVWLNAASSLRYPSQFDKQERMVELTGEAYFEVAHQIQAKSGNLVPFIVKTRNQEVEVLGTHFNINSYPEERATVTTLLEGSVRVSSRWATEAQLLKPRQQSLVKVDDVTIRVRPANLEAALDWKNGDFVFDGDIPKIMRQVARWYNVEVVYKGSIHKEEFGGRVARSKSLKELLEVLQQTTQVRFQLEKADNEDVAARVVVMP